MTYRYHSDLRSDARTLLKTSRTVLVVRMFPGEYYHFGLISGIRHVLHGVSLNVTAFFIEIAINVNSLLIFNRSSNKQLWVI